MMKKYTHFTSIALICLLFIFSCSPQPTNQRIPHMASPYITGIGTQAIKTVSSHLPMTPYTGDIELSFDTALLGDSYKGPRVVLPWKKANDFSIQAKKLPDGVIPYGPTIFQETFTRTGPGVEAVRDFDADRTKRYTIVVINGDAQGKHRAQGAKININGFDWIRGENDFDNHRQEHQPQEIVRPTLLLQAKNTMRIDLTGENGDTITVKIIEGGMSGRIIRRDEPLGNHPTHKSHVEGNDKNWFDPTALNSLGDLGNSVPGNNNTPIPETEQAYISINDSIPPQVINGEFFIHLAEPVEQNLQTILDRYNGYAFDNEGGQPDTRWIKINMQSVDLSQLENNIRQVNELVTDPNLKVQKATFANLESAKTFAFTMEMFADNLVKGVDLTYLFPSTAPIIDKTFEDINPSTFLAPPPGLPISAQKLWWLNNQTTNVVEAWNYSSGFNYANKKPVEIVVIDDGFAGLKLAMAPGKDMEDRILEDKGWWIQDEIPTDIQSVSSPSCSSCSQYLVYLSPTPGNSLDRKWTQVPNGLGNEDVAHLPHFKDHGTAATSLIVSQINNGSGVVGVAPQAKVIPFKLNSNTSFQTTQAFRRIKNEPNLVETDIISMSTGPLADSVLGRFYDHLIDEHGAKKWFFELNIILAELGLYRNVIFVQAAGNGAYDTTEYGNHSLVNTFVVGGLIDSNPANAQPNANPSAGLSSDLRRAGALDTLPANPGTERWGWGSNWGPKVHFWLPGTTNLGAQNMVAIGTGGNIRSFGGTSASTPLLTGIIALMKSLKEDLTPSELNTILSDTAYNISYTDERLRGKPFVDLNIPVLPSPNPEPQCGKGDIKDPTTGKVVKKGINCGALLPPQTMNLKGVNALAAVQKVAANTGILQMGDFTGKLIVSSDHASLSSYDFTSPLPFTIPLSLGGNDSTTLIRHIRAEDLRAHATPTVPNYPVSVLNQEYVKVYGRIGQLSNGEYRLFFSQIKRVDPPVIAGSRPSGNIKVFSISSVNDKMVAWADNDSGTPPEDARAGDNVGATFICADKTNLTVEIAGVNVPVAEVLDDFIAFGIPPNVPQGVQDVFIQAACGNVTFEDAVRILAPPPSPTPTPSSGGGGGGGTPEVVVSFSTGSGFTTAPDSSILSALKNVQDSFGNNAIWLGLPPNTNGNVSYPNVPDIRNPGQLDQEIPLKIEFQVANNNQAGGTITISSVNQSSTIPAGTEGSVQTITFPFAASEATGREVTFRLNGTSSNSQIIFRLTAQP